MKTAVFCTTILAGGLLFAGRTTTPESNTVSYATAKAHKKTGMPSGAVRVVIDKSDYELHVYDSKGWYATYPVVFGANPMAVKKMAGDRLTPEGSYKVMAKRPHQKWSRFLALDYPNPEDRARFEERKRRGEIPRNATPGAGIGIHGTWPNEDFMIDRYKNWTDGCIALKNSDVQEIYNYITVGTTVVIRK